MYISDIKLLGAGRFHVPISPKEPMIALTSITTQLYYIPGKSYDIQSHIIQKALHCSRALKTWLVCSIVNFVLNTHIFISCLWVASLSICLSVCEVSRHYLENKLIFLISVQFQFVEQVEFVEFPCIICRMYGRNGLFYQSGLIQRIFNQHCTCW